MSLADDIVIIGLRAQLDQLRAEHAQCEGYPGIAHDMAVLRAALQDVMDLIESGYLVRDTSHDHEPKWALRQLPAMRKLHAAAMALKEK